MRSWPKTFYDHKHAVFPGRLKGALESENGNHDLPTTFKMALFLDNNLGVKVLPSGPQFLYLKEAKNKEV